jgi:hydantoinase/carbamoylase family amidase
MRLIVSPAAIEDHYRVLATIGNLGPSPANGFFRAPYSNEETAAIRYFEEAAKKLAVTLRSDAARNLFIEARGRTSEFVETGSHLDTVPAGGNFDGTAGVVAGFEALRQLLPCISSMKRGLRLRIWRAEEAATYGAVYAGSTAAFGKFNPRMFAHRYQGKSLEEAMISQGVDVGAIKAGKPGITQEEVDNIAAHIELHIEQGNYLEVGGKDIGVVTGIRGPQRTRTVLSGEFNHSGATPMGANFRRDVNLALAHILVRLDQLANDNIRQGADLVQTIGVINSEQDFNAAQQEVYQNAVTKVSGYGYFTLDIRSMDNVFRERYCAEVDRIIGETAEQFKVTTATEIIGSSSAVEKLDPQIQQASTAACEELGYSYQTMPSGAGHDCAIVAKQQHSKGRAVPVGMLFIPCRGGKSHNPGEFTTYEAIAKGATVLAQTMYRLATTAI